MESLATLKSSLEELISKVSRNLPSSISGNPLESDFSVPQIQSTYGKIATPARKGQVVHANFQLHTYNLTSTEEGLWSKDLASMPEFISLTSNYRSAEFERLSVVFQPNHLAMAAPFTVEAIWVPQSTILSSKMLPATYGSQSFIIGAAMHPYLHPVLEADLKKINPRIKDSVNYNDNPRLYLRFRPNLEEREKYKKKKRIKVKDAADKEIDVFDEDAVKPKTCCVLIKGTIALRSPEIASGEESDCN